VAYNCRQVSNSHSHKKVANSLVALSSAAVLAVYTAGYVRTRSAADRFALQAAVRRPVIPAPPFAAPPSIDSRAATHIAAPPTAATGAPDLKVGPTPAPTPAPVAKPDRDRHRPEDGGERRRGRKRPQREAETPALSERQRVEGPLATLPAPVAEPPIAVVEQAPAAAAPAPALPAKPQYKDGTYLGWGTSRHGDIQAAVVIQDGRIASATIAQCLTRYSCSVIAKLPPQVAERQSPETDYVSGATQSTNAFYYAVVDALSKAK
jgi:uncharacterized protein with FMN-binding domain